MSIDPRPASGKARSRQDYVLAAVISMTKEKMNRLKWNKNGFTCEFPLTSDCENRGEKLLSESGRSGGIFR